MTIRTSSTTVTFTRPFCLGGFDEALPAGTYDVETDEELLEGISFPTYRRIATLLRLHAASADRGRTRVFSVHPRELETALKRDEASRDMRAEHGEGAAPTMLEVPTMLEATADSDCQALDRAENEGMIAYPPATDASQRQHACAASERGGEHDMPPEDSKTSKRETSSEAAEQMEAYGITRATVEYFHYRGFRYMNLRDAVAQAQRQERRG